MVATPIGNLDDITFRAIKVLKDVDIIACEDTRHTQHLLSYYQITDKRTIACHSHNEKASAMGIVKLLEEGHDIAYCSDAGTPCISDPGNRLVDAVRSAGFKVVPVPGVSALATLISVSGLRGKNFLFEGFLSPKSGRRKKRLQELLERDEAFVVYESPFRILKTLSELNDLDSSRKIVLGRELTKAFEQIAYGTASEILADLKVVKGEFVLCVFPSENNVKTDETDYENEEF